MHAIESFAISSGLKISKPWINQKIFPCAFENFIIISDSNASNGYNFSNYIELISLIDTVLESKKIGIIFLSEKPDQFASQNIRLVKSETIDPSYLTHLVRNAKLVIGSDELCAGIASLYEVANIFLGNHDSIKSRGPFFNHKNLHIIEQNNDTKISIEDISNKVLEVLSVKSSKEHLFKTLHMGDLYNDNTLKIIELTPEQILSQETLPGTSVGIRIDYQKSALQPDHYKAIFENLKIRKCSIVTNREFNIKLFEPLKSNISSIIYDVSENINSNFIQHCREITPNVGLIFNGDTSEASTTRLNERKLSLIDSPAPIRTILKKSIDLQNLGDSSYKSKKIIFSKNKAYLSRAALNSEANVDISSQNSQSLKDIKNTEIQTLLSEDQDCIFIFQKD